MTDRHQLKPYTLRIPEELRRGLEAAAAAGNRTLHSEILARLERTLSDEPAINGLSIKVLFDKLDELQRAIASGAFVPFSATKAGRERERRRNQSDSPAPPEPPPNAQHPGLRKPAELPPKKPAAK